MSDVFVLLLKVYVLNLGWQIYTYLDSGHCLYHISTWLPSRDLSWASPYPHYLLIRSSSQSVILLPTQTLKSDALLPNISHHVSGHNQMKNSCTCLAVYVYMCECVCVGSHCWFLALLEHSLPSQHPLHCNRSRIQVNCKLLWLCWATTRQRPTLQAIHTDVHRGKTHQIEPDSN